MMFYELSIYFQVHLRVHSGVGYKETKCFACPMCYICYHEGEKFEKHKKVHPDFDQELIKLSKF